jgi:putative permease
MADDPIYKRQKRIVLFAAALFAGIWFAWYIVDMLLLFFLAIVLTIVLNAPTMWLVSKKIPRTASALIVFFVMLIFLAFIGWLVIPRMIEQVNFLFANLPAYIQGIGEKLSSAFSDYPSIQEKLKPEALSRDILPSASAMIQRLGRFSMSVIGTLLVLILFFSVVVYMLINPEPLIRTYFEFFSKQSRIKAAHAMENFSKMLIGWMWSNLIAGGIEAVSVWIFLTAMHVPGVWVWAGLAIFSEMVPKLGFYLMSIPPTLIALSIDPARALWVLAFYIAMNETLGNFVMPKLRATTMNLHPVFILLVMLVMTTAFGILGAFASTPLAACIKAYYVEFYSLRLKKNEMQDEIHAVLERRSDES